MLEHLKCRHHLNRFHGCLDGVGVSVGRRVAVAVGVLVGYFVRVGVIVGEGVMVIVAVGVGESTAVGVFKADCGYSSNIAEYQSCPSRKIYSL